MWVGTSNQATNYFWLVQNNPARPRRGNFYLCNYLLSLTYGSPALTDSERTPDQRQCLMLAIALERIIYPTIIAFLVERVAEYLACLLSVGSQLCHIAEGVSFFLSVTSSLFNQINDVNVCASYSL
jgi:hypothetical protein